MVLSDSIHQENQQKALELKVTLNDEIICKHLYIVGSPHIADGDVVQGRKAYLSTFHKDWNYVMKKSTAF